MFFLQCLFLFIVCLVNYFAGEIVRAKLNDYYCTSDSRLLKFLGQDGDTSYLIMFFSLGLPVLFFSNTDDDWFAPGLLVLMIWLFVIGFANYVAFLVLGYSLFFIYGIFVFGFLRVHIFNVIFSKKIEF